MHAQFSFLDTLCWPRLHRRYVPELIFRSSRAGGLQHYATLPLKSNFECLNLSHPVSLGLNEIIHVSFTLFHTSDAPGHLTIFQNNDTTIFFLIKQILGKLCPTWVINSVWKSQRPWAVMGQVLSLWCWLLCLLGWDPVCSLTFYSQGAILQVATRESLVSKSVQDRLGTAWKRPQCQYVEGWAAFEQRSFLLEKRHQKLGKRCRNREENQKGASSQSNCIN